jgi:hypothetical protein
MYELCEDEAASAKKNRWLLYFSLIAFFRLSSLRPFPRKVAEIRCVGVLGVCGKNVSALAACREFVERRKYQLPGLEEPR